MDEEPTAEANAPAATEESQVRTPKRKKAATNKARKKVDGEKVRAGTKLEKIVHLLNRKEGCTTADVLKATGWPAVSMPQQAKAAGLKLKKEKDGKVTRYYAA